MDRIKAGVIGCGPRSQGSTIKNILNICEYDLVAICDKYEPLMQNVVKRYRDKLPDVELYTDHRQMLDKKEIEAVFVIVEPENNPDLVCESLLAGKHTYCDVPLAFDMEGCWQVINTVEKTGLKFMLGEQMRYHPRIEEWTKMIRQERLGKILYAQGEYLHGRGDDRYFMDAKTGERINYKESFAGRPSVRSRAWRMPHPIYYLPHELSPLLKAIDDRVTRVSCIGTRGDKSYVHDWFPGPDMEVALMKTENDVILRMAAGFTIDTMKKAENSHHWHHIMGTAGIVEQGRNPQNEKGLIYLADEHMSPDKPAEIAWAFNPSHNSPEILESGHGGVDYWPYKNFAKWLIDDNFDASHLLTIYKAAEATAPAILAGLSAERNGEWIEVPDFRPHARDKSKGNRK